MPQNMASAAAFQFFGVFFISLRCSNFPATSSPPFPVISTRRFSPYDALSHLDRLQFITRFNQVTASTIVMLQTFLQLDDQNQSPFSTHPIAMHVAFATFAAHYFAYTAVLRFPLHRLAFLAHHLLVSSGYIAVASLASVVLPDSAAPFVFAIFGSLSAAELLLWLHRKLIAEEDEAEYLFQPYVWEFYGQRMRRLPV